MTPTPGAQAALLARLRRVLGPLIAAERLPDTFRLQPGLRLRRSYGRCRWLGPGNVEISIRCIADGDRTRWRRLGAITATLLHELAHLRYRHHGPPFWALHRRLVDHAAGLGIFDPGDFDPAERGRGDEKLAGSAAAELAAAARVARQRRAQADRLAVATWRVGEQAEVLPKWGRLGGSRVRVLALGRTRLLVETTSGRRYRVAPEVLRRAV